MSNPISPLRLHTLLPILVIVSLSAATAVGAAVVTVPGDFANPQTAINGAASGDIIEIAAGTYNGTFLINGANANKSLTLRAAEGAVVTFSGGGSVPILRYQKNGVNDASIVFQSITFANGRSTTNGIGGGVTITRGNATFIDCTFENNVAAPSNTGGGAIFSFDQSTLHVYGSHFENNSTPNAGGGVRVGDGTLAMIHDSTFIGNSTSVAGHIRGAAGGAIHMTNAELRISNSRFEGNRAGCVGGAVFNLGSPWVDPVDTPKGTSWIVNSTFLDNSTVPFGGLPCDFTPVGGAVHSENQVELFVVNSRFEKNYSTTGGAITQYRSKMTIDRSVFRGNYATGASSSQGFGGTIMSNSNDAVDETTEPSGTTDRPSSTLTIKDSLVQGRFDTIGTTSVNGGCLWTEGDANRTYGRFGVPVQGSAATNRADVTIDRTIFADCDVANAGSGAAIKGGAITASHTDLRLTDVLIFDSEAPGGGGCLWILLDTEANITDSTFAYCSGDFGGAINASGSILNVSTSEFFGNEADLQGSAIWSAEADDALTGLPDMDARGTVQTSTFSDNGDGGNLPDIYERDRTGAGQPINRMRYLNNEFFDAGNGRVFHNGLAAQQTATGINSLSIAHPQVPATIDKGSGNSALGAKPNLGAILAKPGGILPTTAAGDASPTAPSYLGFAWSGSSATLDGGGLGGDTTGLQTDGAGVHTLAVGGATSVMATISNAPAPAATFDVTPPFVDVGQSGDLSWSTTGGTFVDMAIDRGVAATSAASGTVSISPLTTTEYQLYLLTEEGGTNETETFFVGEIPGLIFSAGFEDNDTLEWTTSFNEN
ncbi:MAG: hypothetical protein AAGE94_05100 [Acidobacteriota bacterium]